MKRFYQTNYFYLKDYKMVLKNVFGFSILTVLFLLTPHKSVGQVFSTPGLYGASASPSSYSGMTEGLQNNVDNFTGSRSINLPIYSFKSFGFSLPISLNYQTNGVKLTDIGGWAGLKWNLSYGGIITRAVKDVPDEAEQGRLANRRYYYFNNDAKINSINDENNSTNAEKVGDFLENGRDKEPDIFTYNVNGQSGQFILDQDGGVKLIPYKNITISPEISSAGWGQPLIMERFTVTDDRGVNFIFDIKEETTINSYGWAAATRAAQYQDYNPSQIIYTSAWYLSRIVLPVTKLENNQAISKEINFTYTGETYNIQEPSSIWMRSCSSSSCYLGLFASGSPNAIVNSTETIAGKRLTSIEDDNTKIEFVGQTSREDLQNTYSLDGIIVSQKFPVLKEVKRFLFNYHYYVGTNDDTYLGQSIGNKRLMLDNVIQTSDPAASGHNQETLYSFEYDESANLPTRYSFEQDFWGYYNHNSANTIFPKLYIFPNEPGTNKYSLYPKPGYTGLQFELDGSDRNPNGNTITLGSLTKINYKTGGYTNYEYEPNDFFYEGSNRLGSGIRIKKTIVHDGIDHSRDIIKEFSYKKSSDASKSSGLLIDMPVFAVPENTHPNVMTSVSTIGFTDPTQESYYIDFMIRNSNPTYFSGMKDGTNQGYTEIVEKSTDNSKVYYKYSLPGYYKQNADDQVGVNCFLETDGYCDGLFKRYFSHYCARANFNLPPDLTGYDFTTNSILPYGPATNYDWNRGLLLEMKLYDADNFLLKENKYTYKLYYPEGKIAPSNIPGLKANMTDNWKLDDGNNWTTNIMGFGYAGLYFFSKYDVLADVTKVIDKKTETNYDKGHPGQQSQTQITYEYGGIYHNYPTKILSVDSKGIQKIEECTYAFDLRSIQNFNFPNTYPQKGYVGLLGKNINALIKKRVLVKYPGSNDEYVLSGAISYFDSDDNHDRNYSTVLLKEQKTLGLKNPLLKTALNDFISNVGVFVDSRYKTENLFNRYDDNANLLESSNRSEKQATVWGNNNTMPIAKVNNAIYSDIAYTSFEDTDGKGGWNYDGAMVDDITSPTGKKCNNLSNIYIEKTSLYINKIYTVSYWAKSSQNIPVGLPGTVKQGLTISGWTYYEHTITGVNSLVLASQGDYYIDELRLYPKNAQMVTSTYEPLIGVTAVCDVNNNITYYEYDLLGRISIIRDQYKNILRTFDYRVKTSN